MSDYHSGATAHKIEQAEKGYRGGSVLAQPYRITMALDSCGLYGPDVDRGWSRSRARRRVVLGLSAL